MVEDRVVLGDDSPETSGGTGIHPWIAQRVQRLREALIATHPQPWASERSHAGVPLELIITRGSRSAPILIPEQSKHFLSDLLCCHESDRMAISIIYGAELRIGSKSGPGSLLRHKVRLHSWFIELRQWNEYDGWFDTSGRAG